MKHLLLKTTLAGAAAVALVPAHADTYFTENFGAAPLSNATYGIGTVPGTGLQVTAGQVAIADGGPGQGNELNLYAGVYAGNYNAATNVGYSTVTSLATFDLLAGTTYTLSYDYSRGFGAGGNGPTPVSLTASFGSHSATYDDVAGYYYGFDWMAGSLTFVQETTELGAHVGFAAAGGLYSSMAVDNISLVGVAPAAVPEPASVALVLAGLGGIAFRIRTRAKSV